AADGTVGSTVRLVILECGLQQLRPLLRAPGAAAFQRAAGGMRLAQLADDVGSRVDVGRDEVRDLAKHGRGRLLRRRFAGDQLLQRLEIPVALLQRRGGRLEALVTAGRRLFDQSDDGLRALLRVVDPLFPQLHRIGQDALDLDELVETERAADRVVQLRRAVLEQRAELVVGKEGAAGLERALPVERLERARLLSRRDDRRLAVFQLVAGPPAAHNERALTFDDELGADGAGTVVVQVAPAVDPGLRATVPAEVAPGQQEL